MPAAHSAPPAAGRARRRRLASALVAAAVLSGCSSSGEAPDAAPRAIAGTTPPGPGAAHLDLSGLPIPRTDVCGLLARPDVEQALAGPVTETGHYGNGEELEVTPGRTDISHEYGCVFRAADGTTAQTWIFARPVPVSEADVLVRQGRRTGASCAFPESVRFGAPSLTSVCELRGTKASGPLVRARLEGLFDDTWMACELTEPLAATGAPAGRADVVQRAEQWCTDVATAVGAATG